jgi:hypothetical protein
MEADLEAFLRRGSLDLLGAGPKKAGTQFGGIPAVRWVETQHQVGAGSRPQEEVGNQFQL